MIRISLVIPTHNRPQQLLAALRSVALQGLPKGDWECVVVANNCSDNTLEAFAKFSAENAGCNFRIVEESGVGVSYARNRGFGEAAADIVAFIDDDEHVNAGFLEAYLSFFDSHPEAAVAGGRIIAEYVEGRPAWMSRFTEMPIANPMDFGEEVREFPRGRVPGGGNMAFRKGVIGRVGGFDPSLGRANGELIGGEENDLFERLLRGGERIWYVPDAVMWHVIEPRKLTDAYFDRVCYNVGVSQRIRAEIHGRKLRARVMEILKWGATLLLVFTMSPAKSRKIVRMRWRISRGLFSKTMK